MEVRMMGRLAGTVKRTVSVFKAADGGWQHYRYPTPLTPHHHPLTPPHLPPLPLTTPPHLPPRRQRVQEKLDAERKSRISVTRKAPRVNAAAAARMLERKTKGDGAGVTPLDDPRFKAMFEKDDFR